MHYARVLWAESGKILLRYLWGITAPKYSFVDTDEYDSQRISSNILRNLPIAMNSLIFEREELKELLLAHH